jgi:rhodanese-related sulfurtransferase
MFGIGKKIDVSEITEEIKDGKALLVDVRGDDEWNGGHAKDAMHLSVDRIMHGELPSNDTGIKLYLYCASGGRAGMAAHYLKSKGFVVDNLGGLSSWRSAGGQVE